LKVILFLSPFSMGQAEFNETLEWLARGWRDSFSLVLSLLGDHRGEARLTTTAGAAELPNVIAPPVLVSQWHLLAQCNQSSLLYPIFV